MSQLTKKQWNTLTSNTRREIISVIYGEEHYPSHVYPSYLGDLINAEYKHDFDFDRTGKKLKEILSKCRVQSDGTIDVVVTIKPTYTPKTIVSRPVKTVSKVLEKSTWYVDYEDKSGDLCHIWVEAYDKQDAIEEAKHEYWDINEIISVRKG